MAGEAKRFSFFGMYGPIHAIYRLDNIAGGNPEDRRHFMGLYRDALPGPTGDPLRFSWFGLLGPGHAVYRLDNISDVNEDDRTHFLGMYRGELAGGGGGTSIGSRASRRNHLGSGLRV